MDSLLFPAKFFVYVSASVQISPQYGILQLKHASAAKKKRCKH